MLQAFLLEDHSKGTWIFKGSRVTQRALKHSKGTPRALGHSRHLDTRALEALGQSKCTWALSYLDICALEGHLSTRALKALRQSRTWVLRHLSGTWALRHSRHFICLADYVLCHFAVWHITTNFSRSALRSLISAKKVIIKKCWNMFKI